MRKGLTNCPRGHKLPHPNEGKAGCTPLYCGAEAKAQLALGGDIQLGYKPATLDEGLQRHAAKKQAFKIPDLGGQEAHDFVEKKLDELLPAAVLELEYQLKLGDDNQRERAATRVLEARGFGKKELASAGGPSILIVTSGDLQLPWSNKGTVEGEVVKK